ncbi:uncharacterized mitochondrial protein AtMg00310-like [Jatropha curcas]|uniref:uncharacterized mitochondrial protein AtMg00310-like n=1 Tax=Jatropha curcas TaxID=180498 RepID=UPI0009D7773B|nr:uncharacterized mitochondrial protein AtMg00310-like [Jatropha curcas]
MGVAVRNMVVSVLDVGETTDLGYYLCLPSIAGKNKQEIFSFLKEKVWKQIQGWKHQPFSKARKEILLKSELQAIRTYAMSIFRLPRSSCDDIESSWMVFGGVMGLTRMEESDEKEWSRICCYKAIGGLNFKRVHEFNLALLCKQLWRFLVYLDALVSRIYRAKYFASSSLSQAKTGTNPSYV